MKRFLAFVAVAVLLVVLVSACATSIPVQTHGHSAPKFQIGVAHPVMWYFEDINEVSIAVGIPRSKLWDSEMEFGGGCWPSVALTTDNKVVTGYAIQSPGKDGLLAAFPGGFLEGKIIVLDMFGNSAFSSDGKLMKGFDGKRFGTDPAYQVSILSRSATVRLRRYSNDFRKYGGYDSEYSKKFAEYAPFCTTEKEDLPNNKMAKEDEKKVVVWSSYIPYEKYAEVYVRPDPTKRGEMFADNLRIGISLNLPASVVDNTIKFISAGIANASEVADVNKRFGPKHEAE